MVVIVCFLIILTLFWWRNNKMDMPSKRLLLLYILFWGIDILLFVVEKGEFNSADITIFSLLSCFSFIVGFSLRRSNQKTINIPRNLSAQIENLLRNKLFWFIVISYTTYVVYLAIKQYMLLDLYTLNELRGVYFDAQSSILGSRFTVINYWLLIPITILLSIVFGYCCLYKRTVLLLFIFVGLFAYSTLGGGRFNYIRYLILPIILFYYLFNDKRIRFNLKKILSILVILITLLYALSIVTSLRSSSNSSFDLNEGKESLYEDLYDYATRPLHAFDYAINNNYEEKINGYKYGLLTFSFVEDLFYQIATTIFRQTSWTTSLNEMGKQKQDTYIDLGKTHWNALYTWNLYFYYDLSIFGLIIFPFLFGYLTRFFICKFLIYPNLFILVIVYVFYRNVLFSPIDSVFLLNEVLLIFFAYLIAYKKRINYR